MVATILVIIVILSICFVIAYKASRNPPVFGDEQLLTQHRRFLEETERSKAYVGATYLYMKEKGSPAGDELIRRGYDLDALMAEVRAAQRERREIDMERCRRLLPAGDEEAGTEEPAAETSVAEKSDRRV